MSENHSDASISSEEINSSPPNSPVYGEDLKICNYCERRTKLLKNKPYCIKCEETMYKECKRCHKPFHLAKYFEKDQNRCNACFEQLQSGRLKRLLKNKRFLEVVKLRV